MIEYNKNYNFNEENGADFADEMLRAIEKDYGRSIMRIPKFNKSSYEQHAFKMSIIFTDFKLLEAEVRIVYDHIFDPYIEIKGIYY